MKDQKLSRVDTEGLSASGIWVRRTRNAPSLADEALSLANVLQTWNLSSSMTIHQYGAAYAEVSSPDLSPTWVYLIELVGRRTDTGFLFANHPLSQVRPEEDVRILAIVQPPDFLIPGALVETADRRRMIWLQPVLPFRR